MPLTSRIENYDARWPTQFESEKSRLQSVFNAHRFDIHHIGSTAVPNLAAKPEVDILVITPGDLADADWSGALATLGYRRGGDLSSGHQFYKRDVAGVRTHKLHVCVDQHPQLARMLSFRDLLRSDAALRQRYADLKRMLERTNTFGIAEYLRLKAPFIDEALALKT